VSSERPLGHRAVLSGWPELGGRAPSPPAIDAARAAFQRGVAAYARGVDADARDEFHTAEALLPPDDDGGSSAAGVGELRRIARGNAEIAAAAAAGAAAGPGPGGRS
jgi:hypothetical protein